MKVITSRQINRSPIAKAFWFINYRITWKPHNNASCINKYRELRQAKSSTSNLIGAFSTEIPICIAALQASYPHWASYHGLSFDLYIPNQYGVGKFAVDPWESRYKNVSPGEHRDVCTSQGETTKSKRFCPRYGSYYLLDLIQDSAKRWMASDRRRNRHWSANRDCLFLTES